MLINFLIIPLLLGISVPGSATLKDLNSSANVTDEEAMRLANSELIRKYMNESIDPCEDFYQFACGNWRTHHPAIADTKKTSVLHLIRDDFNQILNPLLNKTDDKYTNSEWKVKNFYDSCLNLTSVTTSEYRQNMKNLIKEFGRMPALEGKKWQSKKFDWIKTIGEISYKYNIGILYGYAFSDFDVDPTANVLIMKSQLLRYPDTSAEAINKRKSNVAEILKMLLGIKPKTAMQTAKEIVDFGVKLWKANERNGKESETTFEEMHQKYSRSLDVMKLVNTSFGYIAGGVVMDENPSYVESLGAITRKTSKRVLANYIFYSLILLIQPQGGQSCLETTKTYFLPILSNMVYRRSNINEQEPEFHRMWQGITTTLQTTLESNRLSWFDDESREVALEKLHAMKLYIGSFEDINFDELYTDLTLNSSDFMDNLKSITSFNAKQKRQSLNERTTYKHNGIGGLTPSYMATVNTVRFPLSSLVTHYLWSNNGPQALNYGRLGYVTGHEIMHGFSGGGRSFNRLGVYIDRMYQDIQESYEERRHCYYDQYHNFTLDNKPLPQEESQGENLADNGGIYLAYHTYLTWLADESRTQEELDLETLPQLNYTNKQLYFIGYTQFWCSDNYAIGRFERASDDEHSPDEFRGFVPLLNFGEFAKEFNCPIGSPMNPPKKCSIY